MIARASNRDPRCGGPIGSSTFPVGEGLLGRVIDPLGRPLDNAGPGDDTLARAHRMRRSVGDGSRSCHACRLQTGIKAVDALIPVGRGQRELILGDRQTGKSGIALDCILNQKGKNVICIYCAIGQRSSSVAKLIADLRRHDAMALFDRGGCRRRLDARSAVCRRLTRRHPWASTSCARDATCWWCSTI